MKSRPPHDAGSLDGTSPELAQQLSEYRAQGQMIESGHDAIRSGLAMLRDVDRRGRLEPLQLPDHLRFAVVPVTADGLYVEAWQRPRPLAQLDWHPLDKEDLEPYVMWTRGTPRRPVFIGSIEEIDYDSPGKDHWIYKDEDRNARVAIRRGVDVMLRTVIQVERLYIAT